MRKRKIKLYFTGFSFNNYSNDEFEELLDDIEYATKFEVIDNKFVQYEKVVSHLITSPKTSKYEKVKEIYLNEFNISTLRMLSIRTGLPMTQILADLNSDKEFYEQIIRESKANFKSSQLKRLKEMDEK